ncbi:MAG: hypothetical protein QOJ27_19 [Sphingomonadales bacterium]|nr:hypothetical protein [Sphingomonadales bacterium]
MSDRLACLAAAAILAACSAPSRPSADDVDNGMETVPAAEPRPAEPPAPGPRGGLAEDRTPVAEPPFTATSAQGAANIVQTYYALLEEGRPAEARRLWSGAGEASGMSEAAFAASFGRYGEYRARIGAPGAIEGAAGSLYVEVPVELYGRLKSGELFRRKATVTLRRINDVPGSSAEDRRWHIRTIEEAAAR